MLRKGPQKEARGRQFLFREGGKQEWGEVSGLRKFLEGKQQTSPEGKKQKRTRGGGPGGKRYAKTLGVTKQVQEKKAPSFDLWEQGGRKLKISAFLLGVWWAGGKNRPGPENLRKTSSK